MLDAVDMWLTTVLYLSKTLHQGSLRSTQSNRCTAKLSASWHDPVTVQSLVPLTGVEQELIRRWDSERELLRSAPRKLPEFAEI